MKRWLWRSLAAILAVIVAGFIAQKLIGDHTVEAHVQVPQATAVIGSGSGAVAVGADGTILPWLPVSASAKLPALPITEPPKSGSLGGTVLEQARVLGAAPGALRPYLKASHYGESGVDVVLTSGIELLFGDDSQAARKWRAAAAMLADPKIETLGYVDLQAPTHPAVGGSGHTLPPLP